MKKVKGIVMSVQQVFNFRKPKFDHIRFACMVVQGHSYLLFSWQISNALFISIHKPRFHSWSRSGSAYQKLPDGLTDIELVIGNGLQCTRMSIALSTLTAEELVLASPTRISSSLRPFAKLPIPVPTTILQKNNIPIPITTIRGLAIQNLFYNI